MTEYERGFKAGLAQAANMCDLAVSAFDNVAGSGHSPEARALAKAQAEWCRDEIKSLIDEGTIMTIDVPKAARQVERERERELCAKIALDYGRAMDYIYKFKPYSDKPLTGAMVGEFIAAAILAVGRAK